MPNTIVNLGDLKALADKYQRALKRHRGVKLKATGERGAAVGPDNIQALTDALEAVQEAIEEVCEQPVLAVQLIEESEPPVNTAARKTSGRKRSTRKR